MGLSLQGNARKQPHPARQQLLSVRQEEQVLMQLQPMAPD
jgi:hypothetical protein